MSATTPESVGASTAEPAPAVAVAAFSVAQYLGSITRVGELQRILEDVSAGLKISGPAVAVDTGTLQAQLVTLQQLHRQHITRTDHYASTSSSNTSTKMMVELFPPHAHDSDEGFTFHNGNQGNGGSIADQIAHLHRTTKGLYADVHFMVGKGEETQLISGHKLILGLMSPVFGSMFFSAMDSQSKVNVPDVTPTAFKRMLEFLYCGGWNCGENGVTSVLDGLCLEQVKGVFYAARKYCVVGLESLCTIALCSLVSSAGVLELLNVATFYDLEILTAFCWSIVQQNTMQVLETNLHTLDQAMLAEILSRDVLNASEVDLFQFLVSWGQAQCAKTTTGFDSTQGFLGIVEFGVKLIRFPTMSGAEFADAVPPTGLLNPEQIAAILVYINASEDKKPEMTEFSTISRKPPRLWRFITRDPACQPQNLAFDLGGIFAFPAIQDGEVSDPLEFRIPSRSSRATRRAAARRARQLTRTTPPLRQN